MLLKNYPLIWSIPNPLYTNTIGTGIQWGKYTECGELSTAHSFPIAFPNACYGIIATHNQAPHTKTKYLAWATNNIGGTVYKDKFLCGLDNDLGDDSQAGASIFIVAWGE